MKYESRILQQLWNIIKQHKHKYNEKNEGLREVPFTIDDERFKAKYELEVKANNVETAQVKNNIDDVIDILTKKQTQISYHHLSCAAQTSYKNNTALCIHYTDKETNKNYSVALPGINYILTKETLEKLKKIEGAA